MRTLLMIEPSKGPDQTLVQDIQEPLPGPGQVSIDVACAGINFIDVMARRGDPGYVPSWPYAPGYEVAGTIRAIGDGVTGFPVGTRVAAFTFGGGLAEIAVAQASLVAPLPDAVPFQSAAAAPLMLTTALLLLTDAARLRPGERLLMHSASGGVGSAVARLAPILGGGLRVGTVGRQAKVESALRDGWDAAITRGEGLAAALRAAAGGPVDVILDPTGTGLLATDLDLIAPGGRIVLFGNAGGGEFAPLPPLGRLIGGNISIGGFSIRRLAEAAPERVATALRRVLGLLGEGKLHVAVTEVPSLDDIPAAHDLLAAGRSSGKYVVACQKNSPTLAPRGRVSRSP